MYLGNEKRIVFWRIFGGCEAVRNLVRFQIPSRRRRATRVTEERVRVVGFMARDEAMRLLDTS